MNNYENIKSKNIYELTKWLNSFDSWEESPWLEWWNKKYCSNCKPITIKAQYLGHNITCSWCELNDYKCKYFPKLEEMPDNKQMIKLWLESEVE